MARHKESRSNAGVSLLTRFERAGDTADLDAAIDAHHSAVEATPTGHPDRAMYLSNLGNSLLTRFERAGDTADLDAAIDAYETAHAVITASPVVRLRAARRCGDLLVRAERYQRGTAAFAAAVDLMPLVAWHGLDRRSREAQVTTWTGLAADAAACAIAVGRPRQAVELLEQGRSVLWRQVLHLRSDLSLLAEAEPDLAERLTAARAILTTPLPEAAYTPEAQSTDIGRARQDAIDLRRRAAREWDELVEQARTIPGFENFLRPTPFDQLRAAAADGPVILLNASSFGCNAMILTRSAPDPQVVALPGATHDAVIEQANRLIAAVDPDPLPPPTTEHEAQQHRRADNQRRNAVLDVLEWTWREITAPVLDALPDHQGGDPDHRPRVWWSPAGALTVLPVHAAGIYPRLNRTEGQEATQPCVLVQVISSYTPTLAELLRVRDQAPAGPVRHLTVAMPTTPDQTDLPGVTKETERIAEHFPPGDLHHQLIAPAATAVAVRQAIAQHTWAHLACHASQRHDDPTLSGFALTDGTLSIADLTADDAGPRDLAFLSACQTRTGSYQHLDESIHLAAAMQYLGYRHVIATMWSINDLPAPEVADAFYTRLADAGQVDLTQAAAALHDAVQHIRSNYPTDPRLWAPYTHQGP